MKSSTVPRHREINDFLARKICDDVQVPHPQ
jgi:mRNA interferase HicA